MRKSKKPEVGVSMTGKFTCNGKETTEAKARKLWDEGAADWSWGAHAKMSMLVLQEGSQSKE